MKDKDGLFVSMKQFKELTNFVYWVKDHVTKVLYISDEHTCYFGEVQVETATVICLIH